MRRVAAAVALVLAAGCGRVEVHQAMLRAPERSSSGSAEVYVVGQTPARSFYEVALLQALGMGTEAGMESVVHALAQRAAHLGCDAVVNVQLDHGVTVTHGYGVCVRWSPGAPPPPAPPPPAHAPEPDNHGDGGGAPL